MSTVSTNPQQNLDVFIESAFTDNLYSDQIESHQTETSSHVTSTGKVYSYEYLVFVDRILKMPNLLEWTIDDMNISMQIIDVVWDTPPDLFNVTSDISRPHSCLVEIEIHTPYLN